jgi:hypothetical protein
MCCAQFEQAAVQVLEEHYADGGQHDGDGAATRDALRKAGVQVLLHCSGRLTQSLNASIRDLAVCLISKLWRLLHALLVQLSNLIDQAWLMSNSPASISSCQAERVNQLVMVTGIVTAASKPKVCTLPRANCSGVRALSVVLFYK